MVRRNGDINPKTMELIEKSMEENKLFLESLVKSEDGSLSFNRKGYIEGTKDYPLWLRLNIYRLDTYIAKVANKLGYNTDEEVEYTIIVHPPKNKN